MIQIMFQKGTELIAVNINGDIIQFGKIAGQFIQFAGIEGLKFDFEGIVKEFPDLKDKPFDEAKAEAIRRFKEKLRSMQTDDERAKYVIKDLKEYGYIAKKVNRTGFRPKNVKPA